MKIIKPGKPQELKQIKKFQCPTCECTFEAEKGEYVMAEMEYNTFGYACKCPCCGEKCYKFE